jgi:hypothetical protein
MARPGFTWVPSSPKARASWGGIANDARDDPQARCEVVYDFSEGKKDLKDLLGGKGANLAEMTNLAYPYCRDSHHH